MSKISKIANEGIQYDVGGSGDDNIRFVEFDRGFLLLKKVRPDIVTVFLSIYASGESSAKASGNFTGFEGSVSLVIANTYNYACTASLSIDKASIDITLDNQTYTPGTLSCAGIYRVMV